MSDLVADLWRSLWPVFVPLALIASVLLFGVVLDLVDGRGKRK